MEIESSFKQWAIVELMGHIRIAGLVTEAEMFGSKLGRVDVPNGEGFTTQFFNGSSLYRLTPTTEEIARSVAKGTQPEPVYRWELPEVKQITTSDPPEAEYPYDDDDDDSIGHRNHDDDDLFG